MKKTLLDSRKIARSQGESARAKTVLSEREVPAGTSTEEKRFAAEVSRSGSGRFLRKSSMAGKIKPTKGYAHAFHVFLSALMPALVYIFVRINFAQLAILIILITKWRMFAVRPRFWPAIIRANAVDIIVGLSTVVFMTHSNAASMQLLWAVLYMVWQIWIKPGRCTFAVASQALIGQTYGLMALFIAWPSSSLLVLIIGTWAACYLAARHFLTSFEEQYISLYSHTWGYFAAAIAWLGGHWLLFYGVIAQPTLLLTVLGFGLAGLYYLQETDRLSVLLRRQIVFIMIAVVVVVMVFSDWGDKTL